MKIAVIGGGASGIVAAIISKRANANNSVTVFEKNDRILKKILATGNGRCNLSNTNISIENYFSQNIDHAEKILTAFTADEERQFFESIGIMLFKESGRLYPYSKKASAVVDALRFEVEKLNIKLILNTAVKDIKKTNLGFIVNNMKFDRVIISCGGKAAPSFGTDGSSFNIMKSLGHNCSTVSPALVPVKTRENVASLKGIRVSANITLINDEKYIKSEQGELQLTSYGLSGIAIMQLSRMCKKGSVLSIDLLSHMEENEVKTMLLNRAQILSSRRLEDFLTGIIHRPLALYIYDRLSLKKDVKVHILTDKELFKIASVLKALKFTVESTLSFEDAQSTKGGALLCEFNPCTLESLICPGLYCIGEALDCVGDCGGYNLHWAWTTGYICGKALARGSLEKCLE